MDGLEHCAAITNIRRACQTYRACHLCSHIGENVPVEIGHDDYIDGRMFGVDKGIVGNARAYVGIEVKGCASSNVQALIASTLRCRNRGFKKDLRAVQ